MSKPRVGHFIRGFLRPTETFIYNQISSICNYEPIVYCHHILPSANSFNINLQIISCDNLLEKPFNIYQKESYKFFRKLTKIAGERITLDIIQRNIQLLHFHYLVDASFFLPVIKRLKLPMIVSGYGWDVSLFPLTKLGYGRKYLQPIFKKIDLFLAMSEDMKKDMMMLGCPKEKIIVHYYGSDVQRFKFENRDYEQKECITILFCGRLTGKKAPQMLLYALKFIEEKYKDYSQWQLIYVGDGPLLNELLDIVNKYNWENKVIFKGHIDYKDPNLVKEYKNADIYVLPSMTWKGEKEGIPGTLIEAMASGLPVISTYHAGIPSIIEDGINGLLFNEGDIEELSHKIFLLLRDNELRQRLGKNAAQKALNELDLKNKTIELEKIYNDLIKN